MEALLILVSIVFILQVVIFFVIRRQKKKQKEESVIEKYDIRSSSDAFRLIQDQSIPEQDRKKIEALYKAEE